MIETLSPSVFSIPAGVPFATSLAKGIGKFALTPEALARATILVPSRRAALSLRAAFLEVRPNEATLLPRIEPIGDVEEDQADVLVFAAEGVGLPPAMDPLRRQLLLARILGRFKLGGVLPTPPQTVTLAASLAHLLDQLCNADADAAMLRDLLPAQFSQHWQDILQLLKILIDRWPAILAEDGVIDAVDRRNRLLRLRCQIWQETQPDDLIIVAGSTGTFAATRELICTVARLPNGHVVLPGLDLGAIDHWPDICHDSGHPQHQLSVLLDSLDTEPQQVAVWPFAPDGSASETGKGASPIATLRQNLMREAFKPARLTADWRQLGRTKPDLGRDALKGLSLINCKSRVHEAGLIALAMREILQQPGKTAALITPDRQLAEAVIAALGRWKIDVDDSAGRPLSQTKVGGFLHLLVAMIAEDFAPVQMLAFLKHPLAAGGLPSSEFRLKVRLLERAILRGYRPPPGLAGVFQRLEEGAQRNDAKGRAHDQISAAHYKELSHFVAQHVEAPLAEFLQCWHHSLPTLASLAEALGRAAENMASQQCLESGEVDRENGAANLWIHEDGFAAASLLASLVDTGGSFEIDVESFPQILTQLQQEKTVRRTWPAHPRLAILGPVEARMQSADRLILGGFNEGNWPPRPEIDPWSNAEMRRTVGLQPHNWRTGLSAHDVWMAICAPEVIVTRALRDGDAVTTPSRWLQRLEAVLAALHITDAVNRGTYDTNGYVSDDGAGNWLSTLSRLMPVETQQPVARPQPKPPISARPREFSATEVDDWIADPYSVYAKRVLRLRPLDDLDRPIDAALRGNLVHDALASFLKAHPSGPLPDDALDQLRTVGRKMFTPWWQSPNVRVFWWPAFETVAAWFVETERARREQMVKGHAEIDGKLTFEAPNGPAIFKARADRIDQMVDGGLVVLDYKTGNTPTAAEVEKGRRTQLLIEAVIAAYGGFLEVAADDVVAMQYWKLTGRRSEGGSRTDVLPKDWQAEDTYASLAQLLARFDDPDCAYASLPDPAVRPAFPRYNHLARVDEWLGGVGAKISSGRSPEARQETSAEAAVESKGFDPAIAREASDQQAAASDPQSSVFVSANAGTGKTKLLTDRVLRLMLAGAVPDSILCVTYTRAAAAEMRNRILSKLAIWTVMTAEELNSDLALMGIPVPSQVILARARSLFAEILDNDNGPRVETVHSFCQSVLRRFPIEAGVVPNTELADEFEQERLKTLAREAIMKRGDPAINDAIAALAEQTGEGNAESLLGQLLGNEDRLGRSDILDQLATHFANDRGIDPALDITAQMDAALSKIDDEGLRASAAALQQSGVAQHIKRGNALTGWLGRDEVGRRSSIDMLIDALFTNSKPRSSLSNAAIRDQFPRIVDVFTDTQNHLTPFIAARANQQCRDLTLALYAYGKAFYGEYQALKRRRGVLDYDDLITFTNGMLARGEAAQWVAWKLDNGIGHMLLDEAQDTSPAQWKLLRRLSDEFFETLDEPGGTERDLGRSLFIVGDFKQSIYSFQGADPAVMGQNRLQLKRRAADRQIPLRDVSLDVSFRSSQTVLDFVNRAMPERAGITDPRMPDFQQHRSARCDAGGFVEVWNVVRNEGEITPPPGFAPPQILETQDAAAKSAADVATRLASWIGARRLPSGRLMRAGDAMILLRKRGEYYRLLLAALQRAGIPVAGADRMKLDAQIEIQDLLALGDVMLLPDDDLQLASVLKSPLFGIDEDTLFTLAHARGKQSLYARLMEHAGANSQLNQNSGTDADAPVIESLGAMADRLSGYLRLSDTVSVFAFFSHILNSRRENFRRRLGPAVDEALDHFLGLAQKFGASGGVALTEFLALVRGSGGEVRRDMDSGAGDEVRVMTIHGAKGLESPVVILPDMLTSRSNPDQLVKDPDSGFVYWAPGSGSRPDFVTSARAQEKDANLDEENRLLYVALTRARDGIVIGGWEAPHRRFLKDSPYAYFRSIIAEMEGVVEDEDGTMRIEVSSAPAAPAPAALITLPPSGDKIETGVPEWVRLDAPAEPRPSRPLRPSMPDDAADGDMFASPGVEDKSSAPGMGLSHVSAALARGRLAHRFFEVLPSVPEARRHTAAATMISAQNAVPEPMAEALLTEVLAVLALPQLAPLFGPDALAEASITGLVGSTGVAGQIDRMYVGDDQIVIADFKTGVMPDTPPPAYQRQLALYAALVEQLYGDRPIVCFLIWTERAAIQEVTPAMRTAALNKILID